MRIDFHILPIIFLGLGVGLFLSGTVGAVGGLLLIGIIPQGRIICHGIDISKKGTVMGYIIQNELLIFLSLIIMLGVR